MVKEKKSKIRTGRRPNSKTHMKVKTNKRKKYSKMKRINYKRKSNKKVKRKKMKLKLIGGNIEDLVQKALERLTPEFMLLDKNKDSTSGDWLPFKHGNIDKYTRIISNNPEFLRNLFALRMGIKVTASLQEHNDNILQFFNENIARFMDQSSELNYYLGELTFLKLQEKQNKTGAILTGMGHFGSLLSAEDKATALNQYSPSLKTSCTLIDFFLKVMEKREKPDAYRPGISTKFYETERGGTALNTVEEIIHFFDKKIRDREWRQKDNTSYLSGTVSRNLDQRDYPKTICTQADLTKGVSHSIDMINSYDPDIYRTEESIEYESNPDVQRARAGLNKRFVKSGELLDTQPDVPPSPTLSTSSKFTRTNSSIMADAVGEGREPPEIPLDYFPFDRGELKQQLNDTPCVSLPPQPAHTRSVEYGGIFGASSVVSSVGVPLISGSNIFDVKDSGVAWDFPCAGISGHTVEISLFFRLLLGNNYRFINNKDKLKLTKYIIIACLNWMVSYVHHSFREICMAAMIPLWNCNDDYEGFVTLRDKILELFKKQRDGDGYLDPNEYQKGLNASDVTAWYKEQENAFLAVQTELNNFSHDEGILTFNYDINFIKQLISKVEDLIRQGEYDGGVVVVVKSKILNNYESWKTFIDANRGPNKLYAF